MTDPKVAWGWGGGGAEKDRKREVNMRTCLFVLLVSGLRRTPMQHPCLEVKTLLTAHPQLKKKSQEGASN